MWQPWSYHGYQTSCGFLRTGAKVIGNIEEPKANRVIKIPKEVKVDDGRIKYLNPMMLNYVLRPTYLVALVKINPVRTGLFESV